MNIHDLRRCIHVINYYSHSDGCSLHYNVMNVVKRIHIPSGDLCNELLAMSVIDGADEFIDYKISQWDALNIAIRHELYIETEKEIENGDIGKAIENLKNKQK